MCEALTLSALAGYASTALQTAAYAGSYAVGASPAVTSAVVGGAGYVGTAATYGAAAYGAYGAYKGMTARPDTPGAPVALKELTQPQGADLKQEIQRRKMQAALAQNNKSFSTMGAQAGQVAGKTLLGQ